MLTLIKNADYVALFDDEDTLLRHASVIIFENIIVAVGEAERLPKNEEECQTWFNVNRRVVQSALTMKDPNRTMRDASLPPGSVRVIEAGGHLVMPGLVNVHHHFFQTLTRNVPGAQDAKLFDWLVFHYEIWKHLTPEAFRVSADVAIGELLLSGCTATSDHLYLYPQNFPTGLIDEEIRAAQAAGIRFHPTRGSMSVSRKNGGLPPDSVVQDEETILRDCERVIGAYHDNKPFAMVRVALAPCSPFSVSPDLMRETARMAEHYKVKIHTHLAETMDEDVYCRERFGRRPFEFCEDMGWINERAWFAHCVHLSPGEVERMAAAGAGVAHCPSANMRLGSGTAPVPEMLARGVTVGLGVDGSASNDSSNMFAEARMSLMAHRVKDGASALTARQALRMGVEGGAKILGWGDVIGRIEIGWAADLIGVDMRGIEYAGSLHDPLAALVLCGVHRPVGFSLVNGRQVVSGGRLTTIDEQETAEKASQLSAGLLKSAGIRR
ncbi:MAG: 8-oxoguanine deaminase [Candidatus Sumerlaeia bacterium]